MNFEAVKTPARRMPRKYQAKIKKAAGRVFIKQSRPGPATVATGLENQPMQKNKTTASLNRA
jgi:hypothetical protein